MVGAQVDETAEKLDSMMLLVFQHLRSRTRSGEVQRTRQALLDAFFATILNTHKSKFTQYLLWYLLDQVDSPQPLVDLGLGATLFAPCLPHGDASCAFEYTLMGYTQNVSLGSVRKANKHSA